MEDFDDERGNEDDSPTYVGTGIHFFSTSALSALSPKEK
jgi:hypothetical protein